MWGFQDPDGLGAQASCLPCVVGNSALILNAQSDIWFHADMINYKEQSAGSHADMKERK